MKTYNRFSKGKIFLPSTQVFEGIYNPALQVFEGIWDAVQGKSAGQCYATRPKHSDAVYGAKTEEKKKKRKKELLYYSSLSRTCCLTDLRSTLF